MYYNIRPSKSVMTSRVSTKTWYKRVNFNLFGAAVLSMGWRDGYPIKVTEEQLPGVMNAIHQTRVFS